MKTLLAIVGQTAAGKSALGLRLATAYGGEIMAADSKTIYQHLDIGTAKPSPADRAQVVHHLLDLVSPGQSFSVADFQRLAHQALDEIRSRDRWPILVGGSGLYVDSLLLNYELSSQPRVDQAQRARLGDLTVAELQALIKQRALKLPENHQNKRYLIRVLERGRRPVRPGRWRSDVLAVGLALPLERLRPRLAARLQTMLGQGLLVEVEQAFRLYPETSEALKGNAYQAFKPYLDGQISLGQAKANFIKRDLALARKQMTWFKRHSQIKWFSDQSAAYDYLAESIEVAQTR